MGADLPVQSLLANSSDVAAAFGSDTVQIFPVEAPEGVQPPYIVWFIVSGVPVNVLSGVPDMDDWRAQVDVYAPDRARARVLYGAVCKAIEPDAQQVSFNHDGRDPDTRAWRMSADFEFWQPRA